jgi:DNA-binding response OmpR family regulator
MKRILVIEDDPAIQKGLKESLEQEHYEVLTAADGLKGFQMAQRENIDLIILDIMLPGKNGQDICSDLRKLGVSIPILMLTSKKHETDKVLGLELGADDYVTKPFSLRELHARIKALLRRKAEINKDLEEIVFGKLVVNFKKQEAFKKGKRLGLSVKEFEILKYFAQREGMVITRTMLLDDVWGYDVYPTTRTVDNYILSLRKKIEDDPSDPKHILTVHTSGYKFLK